MLAWHSEWFEIDPVPDYPHVISLDLGDEYRVDGLSYMPKQEGNNNGAANEYVISVSDDGQDWQEVATGEFPDTREATHVQFEATTVRYVKLTGLNSINWGPFMAAGALNVFGEPVP